MKICPKCESDLLESNKTDHPQEIDWREYAESRKASKEPIEEGVCDPSLVQSDAGAPE